MGIKLKDVLQLDIFNNSEILAGHDFLDKIVERVSVFDCPIQVDRDTVVLKEGDFFITNFYFWKDDVNDAKYALDFLISCGCSCLCMTTEYIDYFSNDLKEHADKIGLPVISIDYTTSYGDIMLSVSNLIIDTHKYSFLEMKLSNLLDSNNPVYIERILNELNPHFLEYTSAIYCYSNDTSFVFKQDFIKILNQNKTNLCLPYKKGVLILVSYSKITDKKLSTIVDYFITLIKSNVPDYVIGLSNNFIETTNIKTTVSQSVLCSTSTNVDNNTIITYNELGSLSFLLPYRHTDEFKLFYENTIFPIIEYDEAYNKDLLNTLISFVECGGDFKLASSKTYQHENTIRYRILKVKSILQLEDSNMEFFERVSIAVKLHKIYNN